MSQVKPQSEDVPRAVKEDSDNLRKEMVTKTLHVQIPVLIDDFSI